MPRLVYAVLTRDLIVDRETSSTSFIRTMDHGFVRDLPATVPSFYVATLWELDPEEDPFRVTLKLVTPSGEESILGTNDVGRTGSVMHKVNFQIPGIQAKEEGRHLINVCLGEGSNIIVPSQLPLYVLRNDDSQSQK